ncbi:acyl-CoA thioesterase [Mycolicibacterium thermoresistibile]
MTELTLSEVLSTLDVAQVDDNVFSATQMDNATHHIVGGHIAAQAVTAASRTAEQRPPHSVHVYFLRAGDARRPVHMRVDRLRDGGALSTRRVTATQGDEVLLEALASFSAPIDSVDCQHPMPAVPDPETLPPVAEQLAAYAAEHDGWWVRPQPIERRYIDPPPRLAYDLSEPPARTRMWWRTTEPLPEDPALNCALLTYVTGTATLEAAMVMRRTTPLHSFNALIDHAVWFHRPADLTDWVLADQASPSSVAGRGLGTATMYNRTGELVCTATQELYFGRGRSN